MSEPSDISWKKLSERAYKAGYRSMLEKTFLLPHGNTASFDVFAGGKVVCIVALTPDNQVILTQQFRPAQEAVLTELPGGGIKEGEEPEDAAARELLEETGYKGELIFLTQSLESAYSTVVRYNYIALNCEKIQEPQLEDNREPLLVTLMPLKDFKQHLYSGKITDVATGFYALDYLESKTDT